MAGRAERLRTYRSKRSFEGTPEPAGADEAGPGRPRARFVIQEHHARRLHWDLRLEHDGVLASWALPRGVPRDPDRNRLAVHTEDHPIEYLEFAGEIPKGEYGGGTMTIWDSGRFEIEKWDRDKVVVMLEGQRVSGRYALFRTRGRDWMIHRMDPPEAGEPLPERIEPMLAGDGAMPRAGADWAFEIRWPGERAIALCDTGHVSLLDREGRELRPLFTELGALALELEGEPVALDGVLLVLDAQGRPSGEQLARRLGASSDAEIRRRARARPATMIIFDLLHAGRESLIGLTYEERRARLDALALTGPAWQTPAYHRGEGRAMLAAARAQGLPGVVAKRLDSVYHPGRRTRDWREIAA